MDGRSVARTIDDLADELARVANAGWKYAQGHCVGARRVVENAAKIVQRLHDEAHRCRAAADRERKLVEA